MGLGIPSRAVCGRPRSQVSKTGGPGAPERLWCNRQPEIGATRRRLAAKQAAGDDSDIDFSDIPPLTDEQLAHVVRLRDVRRKVPVSVRLDPRVLEWLRSKGEGHLTRINDILLNLMQAERRAGTGRQVKAGCGLARS